MSEKIGKIIGTIIVIAIYIYLFGALMVSCFHDIHFPKPKQPSQWLTPLPSTPRPTSIPTSTPSPTLIPTPTPTLHPDLKTHYVSREWIDGYESMSESHIQELLDMFDEGYEFKEEEIWDDNPAGLTYDDGYKDGYKDGYEDAENEFNDSPDYEPSYDYDDWIMGN